VKRFLKKRFLGIPVGIVAAVLVGMVALAASAWVVTHLTSTGTLTVTPPSPNYEYTITPTNLVFAGAPVPAGVPFTMTATATVENTGNQGINGFTVSNITYPSWMAGTPHLVAYGAPIAPGTSGVVTFTLTGTAPTTPGDYTINITCDFTPTGP
jgi:hypothetical protein